MTTSLGDFSWIEPLPDGWILHTDAQKVRIRPFFSGAIQLTAVQAEEDFPPFSYAVITEPDPDVKVDWEDNSTHFVLRTESLILEIQKSPLRFCLKNTEGQILNEDDTAFGTLWQGNRCTTYKKLQPGERFLGLGEKTGPLDRAGRAYTLWNTDAFAYSPDTDPLYASIPFYMGWHSGRGYGILFDNTARATFDFGASNDRFASFGAEFGAMDYFLIGGKDIPEILQNYSQLTGKMPMPPRWALGFQQCRYSYYPQHEVLHVARSLRRHGIPADVIYLDIHYMDQYKVFTWDKERFPDPQAMVEELRDLGFRLVLIIDPGVKVQKDYVVFESGEEQDVFLKYPDGSPYRANVWPGQCQLPDFTDAQVRLWWGSFYEPLLDMGIAGFWNDMNEPAVWGQHIPDIVQFSAEGNQAHHLQIRNAYGMQMARSTYDAQIKYRPESRPFVLTRAGFAGIQRYAALWTGDNVSYDAHRLLGVQLINSLGLSGVPFAGYDVGGFVGNPSPELYIRWMQTGAFAPFFRAHTMINTPSAEPWSFGEEALEIARNYVRLRYRLLPTIYSIFREAAQTGVPVARSLAIHYPDDPQVYAYDQQFLLGKYLLIAPTSLEQDIQKVYLPKGDWYDFFTDAYLTGDQVLYVEKDKECLPIFVRGGGVLWEQSQVEHTGETPDQTLCLHLYNARNAEPLSNHWGKVFYDDDGESQDFTNGNYYQRKIYYDGHARELRIFPAEGSYVTPFQKLRVYFHGYSKGGGLLPFLNGRKIPIQHQEEFRWIAPVSHFDPFFAPQVRPTIQDLPYVEIDWCAVDADTPLDLLF